MRYYLFLLLILIATSPLLAQDDDTPVIKVKKPKQKEAQMDTTARLRSIYKIALYGGKNYSFNLRPGNYDNWGWEAGAAVERWQKGEWHGYSAGVEYSRVVRNFEVSPWDSKELREVQGYERSQVLLTQYKFPVMLVNYIQYATKTSKGTFRLDLGVVPSYLAKTHNEHERLHYSDFRKFNCSFRVRLGVIDYNHFLYVYAGYSADLFQNLNDRAVYDNTGNKVRYQRSKLGLLSVGLVINLRLNQ